MISLGFARPPGGGADMPSDMVMTMQKLQSYSKI